MQLADVLLLAIVNTVAIFGRCLVAGEETVSLLDRVGVKGAILDSLSNGAEGLEIEFTARKEVLEDAHSTLVLLFGDMVVGPLAPGRGNGTDSACAGAVATWAGNYGDVSAEGREALVAIGERAVGWVNEWTGG